MNLRRSLLLASLLAALAPGDGFGAEVSMVSRDVPIGQASGAARALSARPAPVVFDMVGLHWRGSGGVWFRTAVEPGAWSAWRPARPEDEDLPDAASSEGDGLAGWKLGNPYWTGPSRWIQYRLSGRVTRLRAFFLRIPVTEAPVALAARADAPAIIRRRQWHADESIVRGRPSYADRVHLSIVHHTAGTNSYTRAQSAGIVRGIQRYHVLANGWDDIGYNFLVDRYGQVFEGRGGGIARNVVGAHAKGFNTGSVGVALLGTYASTRISSPGRASLQRLLAWRLDVAHVDPVSNVTVRSYGNERFPDGTRIRLRAVSGHRDTGYTTCPGTRLYGELGVVARAVSGMGLPKLYKPEVKGVLSGPVRFTARLSGPRAWLVAVKDRSGAVVAEGRGAGRTVAWTWDSSAAPIDRYTYVISSGSNVRAASGVIPRPPPLAVTRLRVAPAVITPNGDGSLERTRISFALPVRATVRVTVLASGTPVRTLVSDEERPAGVVSVRWDGTHDGGAPAADGPYRVRVTATTGSEEALRSAGVLVDRTLGALSVSPRAFSPNGDRRAEELAYAFDLTRAAQVRVRVLRGPRAVTTVQSGRLDAAGRHRGSWNGRVGSRRASDGRYTLRVEATTSLGTRKLARGFRLDTTGPRVQVLSARVVRGVTRLRLRLNEPAQLRIWYGTRKWNDGSSIVVERPAGDSSVWRNGRAGVVRLLGWDALGNRGRAVTARPVG
jgi:flagellar hook assembly protein FlgD